MSVCISKGNSKMGMIPSVSLPAGKTCRTDCTCQKKCYAKKLERIYKNVKESYQNNLEILRRDPEQYWREVEAAIMTSRFFRFHVSGDIPDDAYLKKMVEVVSRNKHCEVLCFTKKYSTVNGYQYKALLGECEPLPENLHMVFSGWNGLRMENPFEFPEAHVRYRDGTTTASDGAHQCGGNCTECAVTDGGCWTLQNGEQVVFDEH